MRPIDADALIAEYDRVHVGAPGGARKLMEDASTLEVIPVVHGRWIDTGVLIPWRKETGETYRGCSACGGGSEDETKFCPHCAAIMDGESEES